MATLNLTAGNWRHSSATIETHNCKSDGSWTPCRGGDDAGADGDGYCEPGYRGPRCELCDGPAHTQYFDKLDARCRDCGDVKGRGIAVASTLAAILLASVGLNSAMKRSEGSAACQKLLMWNRNAHAVWQAAGMRFKVKVLVGFYQCLSAVPSVFDVAPPTGLEEYAQLIHVLEYPADLEGILIPTSCLGTYRERIWLGASWPIIALLLSAAGAICSASLQDCRRKSDQDGRSLRASIGTGLSQVLPLMLYLTFLVVPSTSTRIFKTFLCESIEHSTNDIRRVLSADLSLSCNSDEYGKTRATAVAMLFVWPVGIPLLYAVLLWASRDAILSGSSSRLSRATSFLWADYTDSAFWWEPLEMCRKLALSTPSRIKPETKRQHSVLCSGR